MEGGEHVDELGRQRRGIGDAEALGRCVAADDAAFDVLHDEEARADDGVVIAVGQGLRRGEATLGDTAQHRELPAHVVRGRHDVPEWRAADDQRSIALSDEVGDIRQPAREADRVERAGLDQASRGKPGADRVEVEAFGRRHGRTLPGGTP